MKLFKCSQVLIEYLLSEYNRFKSSENERKSCNNLVKENKKLRKLLEIQQKAMTYSRTLDGGNGQCDGQCNVQCPYCPKVFFDAVFLKTHINRRHPNQALDSEGVLVLTNKIQDYQKIVIGDKSLDKLKSELQELTEKLSKTELNLVHEKEERIKLEKRIENVMKIRDKELQQTIKEELEELKFVQRERDIERTTQKIQPMLDEDNHSETRTNEFNHKSRGAQNIEDMIAFQAKEMTKLGNNFQKLVSHLTNSSNSNSKEKKMSQLRMDFEETRNELDLNQNKDYQNKTEIKNRIKEVNDSPKKLSSLHNERRQSKESLINSNNMCEDKEEKSEFDDILEEIKTSLNEKFISFGIDANPKRLTEQQFSDALKRVSEERLLAIQQNRHDFNYESIEQQIKIFVDKKVAERSGKPVERSNESFVPKPKERRRSLEKTISSDKDSPQKCNQQSVEAIVHSLPINEVKVLSSGPESDSESDSDEETVIEHKPEANSVSRVTPVQQTVIRKSVLKPILNDRKSDDIEIKAQQKRIRFSEHRTEYQISPDESSEDTSEEYNSDNLVQDSSIPIPAQRTRKDVTNSAEEEDSDKEISDYLMSEIENQNESAHHNLYDNRQTKVQELAEMIEKQLNKRSAAQKKPPVGSVNVMTGHKESAASLGAESDSD